MEKIQKEQMKIVIVGHVDHGKSTVIGRLLADTGSLPEGKLDQVKQRCAATAKPFEYAFLLDALQDEQDQGITIDAARCFFKSKKRDYIILDAPGHIEFLKNMVTGAAHAEAALLVIDANEGIQENSTRHGYLLSMLNIKQVVVLVNKMDLVDFDQTVFENIKRDYSAFLAKIGITAQAFVPISARDGVNIVTVDKGDVQKSVLEEIDSFKKEKAVENKPFRFPVQDVYKFTESGDDRRIFAGTVESGAISVGDEVKFYPSLKKSIVKSIEGFNRESTTEVATGAATGFTLEDELYIKPGEIMGRSDQSAPEVSNRINANIFWMGRAPLIKGKKYKLKTHTHRAIVRLAEINSVLDASSLDSSSSKDQVDRHDVAECVFEATKPFAFERVEESETLGRFVLVDGYEIAGGGIISESLKEESALLDEHISNREKMWENGGVTAKERTTRFRHRAKCVLFTGDESKTEIAKSLERKLFDSGFISYFLGLKSVASELESSVSTQDVREESITRLGEISRIVTDTGVILISTLDDADRYDVERVKRLNSPSEIVTVHIGTTPVDSSSFNFEVGDKTVVEAVYKELIREQVIPDFVI